ncbi:hypothetical protein MPSEU_000234000 [Mayamaea pseudoterrestris]|nr:hypothetical protein MPSEU_000234000 [Mayamaea pseudoterrestris]
MASNGQSESAATKTTYESIMGLSSCDGNSNNQQSAVAALSNRLQTFRKWLVNDAKVSMSSAVCIVNGEATDGTKNAPMLVIDRQATDMPNNNIKSSSSNNNSERRIGVIDSNGDQTLYDRTMGCQVRVVRAVEKDETLMSMPRGAFVTPDLVASSDAGRVILACSKRAASTIDSDDDNNSNHQSDGFWDVFENTTICEQKYMSKIVRNTGPQLLVKILQERKKVEMLATKRAQDRASTRLHGETNQHSYTLAEPGTVSTRAPLLAFIIHQRFADEVIPPVQSPADIVAKQFETIMDADDDNAFKAAEQIQKPPESPDTFAPYARTLPSSVGVPLCWKRSELALLASSLPGLTMLQEVAARTMQLASEYMALMEAGVLERFPETFPEGLITWDRWVWAAATVSARFLPAATYIDRNVDCCAFRPGNKLEFQSPPEIWSELGVLIPLMDMFNHEIEENQVTWLPPSGRVDDDEEDGVVDTDAETDTETSHLVTHKRIKKGNELFTCYGLNTNHDLIMQYGFAQLSNRSDQVKLGWGLADSVGCIDAPCDYKLPIDDEKLLTFCVFETANEEACQTWWSDDRIALLEKEAFAASEDGFMESLKGGKKMTAIAYSDGSYHPILLSALVVATMPKVDLHRHVTNQCEKLIMTKRHQVVLQCYLVHLFSKKLEKLLQNVSAGLKDHFETGKLWTGASCGGIRFKATEDEDSHIGWQSFLDCNAYTSTIEVENHYYAMGVDSCVLALLDGQLRALQISLDGVKDQEKFQNSVLAQLLDLGFELQSEVHAVSSSEKKSSPKNRKRNRQNRTPNGMSNKLNFPSLKLHIGNLAFSTTVPELADYFSRIYGRDNILDVHIPLEKDTNRSRGFGFVTLPEPLASKIVDTEAKHDLNGRLLKLARSSSASAPELNRAGRITTPNTSSDRCTACGYRPKYCTCRPPSAMGPLNPYPNRGPDPSSLPPESYYRGEFGYRDAPTLTGVPRNDLYHDQDRYGSAYDRHGGGGRYDESLGRRSRDREVDGRHGGRVRSRSPRDWSDGSARRGEHDAVRGFRNGEHERHVIRSDDRDRKRGKY